MSWRNVWRSILVACNGALDYTASGAPTSWKKRRGWAGGPNHSGGKPRGPGPPGRAVLSTLVLAAVTWFVWVAPNGVLSLTDERGRVPVMHRFDAVQFEPKPLACYPRLSTAVSAMVEAQCMERDEAPMVKLGR